MSRGIFILMLNRLGKIIRLRTMGKSKDALRGSQITKGKAIRH